MGSVLAFSFRFDDEEFVTINGGPVFTFTPGISLSINCTTKADRNPFWEAMSTGVLPARIASTAG
ncbi:MAG: VOC family protein [Methanomicrobiales archaeon]